MLKNTHTRTLAQISQKIKAVEKRKLISGIVEIGKLLREGERLCEHGEYVGWIRREFSWSHQTALNYRNVFDLTQNPNHLDFDKLNITQSALYLVAGMRRPRKSRPQSHHQYRKATSCHFSDRMRDYR